jgi:hypothetical protein
MRCQLCASTATHATSQQLRSRCVHVCVTEVRVPLPLAVPGVLALSRRGCSLRCEESEEQQPLTRFLLEVTLTIVAVSAAIAGWYGSPPAPAPYPPPLQVDRLGDPAAAFHLARQYEAAERISEAIKFYTQV